MNTSRNFTGRIELQEALLYLLETNIDTILDQEYDEDRANTIPSVLHEGMVV